MKILSLIFRRVLPFLLLAACTAAVLLFAEGTLSLPFLKDESPLPPDTSPLGDGTDDASGVLPPEILQTGTADSSDTGGEPLLPPPTELQNAMRKEEVLQISQAVSFTPQSSSALQKKGYTASWNTYAPDTFLLGRADTFTALPKTRSYYDGYTETVEYVRPDEMSAPKAVYTSHPAAVSAVQLYMGYVLVDNSVYTAIYSPEGNYLFSYLTKEYFPAKTRDRDGNPLFYTKAKNENGQRVTVYCTVGETSFIPSDYNDTLDGRGLYFDYVPSYGLSDSSLQRFSRRDGYYTKWAFGTSESSLYTAYKFYSAFNYREGVAATVNAYGHLSYVGRWGYQAFTTESSYYYHDWYVREYLLPPLTDGEESIGFYYYDHGLVRARRQIVDWYAYYHWNILRVAVDDDFLMDKSGGEFPIPAGYDIVSYSDGVILLEKDKKYGYMDYTGKWIAQPIYDYARPFFEGCAVLGFGGTDRMMIDTEGNIVIPAGKYTYISDFSSGIAAAYTADGAWEILCKMEKTES